MTGNLPPSSIPNTFLNDPSLSAADIEDLAEILPSRPQPDNDPSPVTAVSNVPAAVAAPEAEEAVSEAPGRRGHSGSVSPLTSPVMPDPIVVMPGPVVGSPTNPSPSTMAQSSATLRDSLARALEDRVKNGELSREESGSVMKDMLAAIENEQGKGKELNAAPRTMMNDGPKSTPEVVPDLVAENEPEAVKKNPSLKPQGITIFGTGSTAAVIPASGENSEMVAGEMSKILTQFGKLSLEPDNGKGGKAGNIPATGGKAGSLVGLAGGSSGVSGGVPSSDNSASTPSIVSKSGGTLVLTGPAAAAFEKKEKRSWLDKLVSKFVARRKAAGTRSPASPIKESGLPGGALSLQEPMEANFVPDGMSVVEASVGEVPERVDGSWFSWLGGAAVALSAFWALRRRSEEEVEPSDEQQAG